MAMTIAEARSDLALPPVSPKPKGVCKYPGCNHPDPQPPYRYLRDGVPSVTAISGMIDLGKSPSFGYAAATIAAVTAVHQRERWSELSTEDCGHEKDTLCNACRFLRAEHAVQWDTTAILGSHVHHLAESWANGLDVDQDEHTKGYLDAIELFYRDARPTWELTEVTVAYTKRPNVAYRGKFDGICEVNCPVHVGRRCRWLVDWKTGRYYPHEQTLQLAAYRFADLTEWQGKEQRIVAPVPKVHHCGVVLLTEDGSYRLAELPADRTAHRAFLQLRRSYEWHKAMTRWEKEHKENAA